MQPEKAQVIAGAQAGHEQLLLGDRRRRLFQHGLDLVQRPVPAHQPASDGAIGREQAFVRRLHGRDRCVLRRRDVDQLPRATRVAARHVEMVADEMQERFAGHEFAPAQHRMPVTARVALGQEAHAFAQPAAGVGVGRLVAGADDHPKFLHPRVCGLLQRDLQGGLRLTLLVDEDLQRQGALPGVGGGDEGFADFHGGGRADAR